MEDHEALAREGVDRSFGWAWRRFRRALSDSNGFRIEVATGRQSVAQIDAPARSPVNDAHATPRLNKLKRLPKGRSHVKRLGHCVLNVRDLRESEAWYKSRFGLITSDEINLGSPERVLGAFLRCDRGPMPSDHHTIFLLGTGKPGFNHAAFEVADFDDLMCGHDFLKEKARRHEWGCWTPSARKPDFRLLARSLGLHLGALDRRRPSRRGVGFPRLKHPAGNIHAVGAVAA
jgi:catechol 2,3-dioxygenase-like lactoylglutathione lyase family enzyme